MSVKVYKFGGASIKDADAMHNVADIISKEKSEKIVLVVSAMGKTTNALEKVANAYYNQDGTAQKLLLDIKEQHTKMLIDLGLTDEAIHADMSDTFVEIDWMIEDPVQDGYNYIYDQIVSIGELVSSKLLYYTFLHKGINAAWLDVRDVLITDNTYREANVMWQDTQKRMVKSTEKLFSDFDIIITQGFIGCSTENFNTTLGREGSDFSAAIFSYCLDAVSLTIWKDVPGILTADPRLFENVSKIDRLDYREAIEMTYFGAKVIHPKTIKPLQNKAIPLYVKPFNNVNGEGTIISNEEVTAYPPVVVIEQNQCLMHISTKDFSFVAEQHLSEIFGKMNHHRLKVNMMRNTAISFSVVTQDDRVKLEKFMAEMQDSYTITIDRELELITIRHYDGATEERMKSGKIVLFEEAIKDTYRMVVKDVAPLARK